MKEDLMNKLNNKGFTVIEVVISFALVVVILSSMFVVVINYQNKTEMERIKSSLLTYKNTILQTVYNDIISENMQDITSCGDKCIMINTKSESYVLKEEVSLEEVFLVYRDTKYFLADSKNGLSKINDFIYNFDTVNKVYEVNIPIIHAELNDEENRENIIKIVVSGKEFK